MGDISHWKIHTLVPLAVVSLATISVWLTLIADKMTNCGKTSGYGSQESTCILFADANFLKKGLSKLCVNQRKTSSNNNYQLFESIS